MRKLKLQVQVTVDGLMAGPEGEMDWASPNWSQDLNDYVGALTETVDCIVLGRKLAEGFIPYWNSVAEDISNQDNEAGKIFTDMPKIVFSRIMEESVWENTQLENGDLTTAINELKNLEGKDIIVYGGSDFVSSLINEDLIDEYHLLVNPVGMGEGLPVFGFQGSPKQLKLINAKAFDCGIALLHYERV
ncbi:dihydrofolate reductase [Dyadobacter luteus]|uniref:Dihydrofolate reductase n=1 Tax=Dyadobacter luteus TaxID=2259619 RepID=A0A3D8YEW6_9BACT|nr:dihydrofolate reductase family protein [Dyadobacter luteus]REA62808.1 dihydrofolate reductase [Dyadobacter luteus]